MVSVVAVVLLGLCMGLVRPAPAFAMRPSATGPHAPPGGVYGGRTTQRHPMSLRLTRDGNQLRDVFFHVDAGMCESSPTQSYQMALHLHAEATVAVHTHGTFRDTRHANGITQAGDQTHFSITLRGKLNNTKAAGTIGVSGTVRDADGTVIDRCESGTVRWTLRRENVYGGATADAHALSIRVDRFHKRLTSFFIDFRVVCDSTIYFFSLEHLSVAVRRDGSFRMHGLTGLPLPGLQGSTVSGQYWLRGKLGTRRASGTYRALGTARLTDGSALTCHTGVVRWTATRA